MSYKSNLSYAAANTARSALSTLLGEVDGHSIGTHLLVVRLLKGISNKRPPQAKYQFTWDASVVLNMFNQWKANSELTLSELSIKLVALMALASGQRVKTLSLVRIQNIKFNENVTIYITDRLK